MHFYFIILALIFHSTNDFVCHTDWFLLMIEGGLFLFHIYWFCSTFEIGVYCKGAFLLILHVFEYESRPFFWENVDLVAAIYSFAKKVGDFPELLGFYDVRNRIEKKTPLVTWTEIAEKCGEVGNESIVLIPIEKIHFSFVLFIRNIDVESASPFLVEEREDVYF